MAILVFVKHSIEDLWQGQEYASGTEYSLSTSLWHSVNADMKSKIIVSHKHFFADVNFSATSKVQNYQNKTGEKYLYPNKSMLTTYFKKFWRYFEIYALFFIFSKL